jgi:hypothetical protein
MSAQRLRQFSETYFGEHGGYAQQYLFHQARSGGRGDRAIEVHLNRRTTLPKLSGPVA